MQVRTVAAVANGALVLTLYVAAWGVPPWTIAITEVGARRDCRVVQLVWVEEAEGSALDRSLRLPTKKHAHA